MAMHSLALVWGLSVKEKNFKTKSNLKWKP
uniref:Uncharacterized protein n=1 Tax=Anguilla anguilla TaxID=7936 RepID=A0A0E9T1D0_ANGAN